MGVLVPCVAALGVAALARHSPGRAGPGQAPPAGKVPARRTGSRGAGLRATAALAALLLPLIACAPQERRPPPRPTMGMLAPPTAPGGAPAATGAMQRVGLLLPLSGGNAPLGEAMLNAAQLALFDQGDRRVEFLPRDTRSTASGAAEAARAAMADGAQALAGPLTLTETAAVARVTGLPVFAFTSDEAQATTNVWVLGLTPTQQVRRVMAAAGERSARRFALLAPDDAFGQRLAAAMRAAAEAAGWPVPAIRLMPPRSTDFAGAAPTLLAAQPDAVLIGFAGPGARAAAQALMAQAAITPGGARPLLLGTALWAGEAGLGAEPALEGALFPAPDPTGRERFDQRYAAAFENRPPRLAGPAYDAAALAARTVREGAPPLGAAFLGADGPLRLDAGGAVQRGLAVFALRPGGEPMLVQPAPVPGGPGS